MADPRMDRGELDALAAEYVIGALPAQERADFAARLDLDATARALVAEWERLLSGMDAGYAPVAAPDVVAAVEARLFGAARRRRRVFILLVAAGALAIAVKAGFWLRMLGLL